MRKVLIISYYYSDVSKIGAVRINGLAKFLPKFGWQPYILTASSSSAQLHQSHITVYEAPYVDVATRFKQLFPLDKAGSKSFTELVGVKTQKNNLGNLDHIINMWKEVFAYPDLLRYWKNPAVKLGKRVLESESFDAMISSSPPKTCNLIAKELKQIYGIPWIADFRDLWTQNHFYEFSRFRYFFERRLELRTLSIADMLTVVSEPSSEKQKELFPDKKIFSIPNGFDPIQKNPGLPLERKFTITYTGSLYKGRRDPELLFRAINNLISKGSIDPNDMSINFYGPKEAWLENDIKMYDLDEIVKINGFIPRDESIDRQRRSHLLLLLTAYNKKDKGVIPGKIFDYLAAGRPIISLGASGSVVEDLVKNTGAGFHPVNQDDMERFLMDTYIEYKSNNTVKYNGLPSEIDKYSHIEMARKFSKALDNLIKPKKL